MFVREGVFFAKRTPLSGSERKLTNYSDRIYKIFLFYLSSGNEVPFLLISYIIPSILRSKFREIIYCDDQDLS